MQAARRHRRRGGAKGESTQEGQATKSLGTVIKSLGTVMREGGSVTVLGSFAVEPLSKAVKQLPLIHVPCKRSKC